MISACHQEFCKTNNENKKFTSVKSLGTILSIEIATDATANYFNSIRDVAYNYFIEKGFLIRPLGNVVFVNPPYSITEDELKSVYDVILDFVDSIK